MSRLPFELLLALRYLRPKRTFVSIITLISVLGVTLGVAVLIIVISVMSGFDRDLQEKFFGFNAHLTIFQVDPARGQSMPLADPAHVIKIVKANPAVVSASAFVASPVVFKTEPDSGKPQFATPFLRGIDLRTDTNASLFTSNLVAGVADLSSRGLLVGEDFARNNYLAVGDHVAISSPNDVEKMLETRTNGQQEVIPPADFEIRGVYNSGFYEYNSQVIVASLDNAQDLLKLGDDVLGVLVMVKDPYQAMEIGDQLRGALGEHYGIRPWEEEDNSGMGAVMVEKNVMLYIMFFIVIVAAFGITCTEITFVVLKTREIGVLKALGATNQQIMWIFLAQSFVASFFGILLGLGTGILAVVYRNQFLHAMRNWTGKELFPAKMYHFYDLPAQILPGDLVIICGGSLVICLLAAAFPAWNASRLKPVEALRNE